MFKLRNLFTIGVILVLGILVYNRFLGTPEEQTQAKTTFQTIGKAFKEVNRSKQSHYFISIDDKTRIDYIVDFLNNKKWDDYTVGPRSISKNELNLFLNSLLNQ